MVTAFTLEDSGPTNTITFGIFKKANRKLIARNFGPLPYALNEGVEVVHLGEWTKALFVTYVFYDDDVLGDTAMDKQLDFENIIRSGGDNEGLWTLTHDTVDSIDGSKQEVVTGKINNIMSDPVAGATNHIKGTFEFWEDTISPR